LYKGDETLEQVDHRGSRCLIPRSVQGQVGLGFEQPIYLNMSLPMAEGLD